MKKSILITMIVFVCLSTATLSTAVEKNSGELVLMRVYERYNKATPSRIIVSTNGEIIKEIPLTPAGSRKGDTENTRKISKVISEYKSKGYNLVASNSSGSPSILTTTFVFEK